MLTQCKKSNTRPRRGRQRLMGTPSSTFDYSLGDSENHAVEPVMVVRNIRKHFGDVVALSDVRFSVFAGEVLGLIGPNGSGKTTLLECLCGLRPADRHDVDWDQTSLAPHRARE